MRHLKHLSIWRDANRLLLAIEQAVCAFPRYCKYTLGSDLRRQAMQVCRLIRRAADQGAEQACWLAQLVEAIDGLKSSVQLAVDLEAFRSFKEFQTVVEAGYPRGGMKRRLLRFLNLPLATGPEKF